MTTSPMLDFNDQSLKNFFLGSPQSMWIADLTFESILEVNHTAEKTFGYNRTEFLTTPLQNIILPKAYQKLPFDEKQLTKELGFIANSGKKIYAETTLSAILLDGKEAWLFTIVDVTEKKMYRQMLEEGIDEELSLKAKNKELKDLAYMNFHLVRKPLANILGLVNVLDVSINSEKTLAEVLAFLKESGNELDELIKNLDPQQY
ncbi:MAG: PAS domain S-box protein [Mucilaginibacter sp.]|uniref:PAS domain S-box protein n=1 Tax=Mucilaginibacter sp. TaxID=1882438 RepID=UPI0034E452B3